MGLLFWLTLAPLIAAVIILLLPKFDSGFYRGVALIGSAVSLVLTFVGWEQFNTHATGFQLVSSMNWFTLPNLWRAGDLNVSLSFGVDGLSLTLVTLAAVVSLLTMIGAKPKSERNKEYFMWMAIDTFGIFGVFTALNLFSFFLALEVTLVATFFLIYLFGEPGRQKAAFKFLIYRGLASVALLVAFVGLAYGAAGAFGGPEFGMSSQVTGDGTLTFDIPSLLSSLHKVSTAYFPEHVRSALFLVLLLAVLIEEAFVPFHTWLPTAHESSDTATNMLLGGVLTKTGAYILLRFGVGLLPGEVRHWGVLIAVLGTINILYGAFVAWAQSDWRRLIAFGSISHMGLVLLGIAALNSAGLQGAMFMIVSSGLLTAMLFYITGSLKDRTNTVKMNELGGLSKSMPTLSGFLMVAALGSLGLPLTSGFISEIQAFIGGFDTYPAISFVAALGVILSAVYLLYAIQKTTFGPTSENNLQLADATALEYVPMVVFTALVLLIGVYPNIIGNLFGPTVTALLRIGIGG